MGDRLVVRGPKRAEALVKLLALHKAEAACEALVAFGLDPPGLDGGQL